MRTVKRIYVYVVCSIGLEVVLWGMIGLGRLLFARPRLGSDIPLLAAALSLILVGLPVFLAHWLWAQRDASRDEDERASGARAVFLYGVLLGTLIPAAQNGLAVINRLLMPAFRVPSFRALIGGGQSLSDNLIALFMNLLVAAYFFSILRGDWKSVAARQSLTLARRVYRYLWVFYGLILLVVGAQKLIQFVIQWVGRTALPAWFSVADLRVLAANGLALALVGAPVWAAAWLTVQRSLSEAEERASLLRLGVLYFLSLAGVTTVLTTGAIVVRFFLRLLLGEQMTWGAGLSELSGPLSIGIPIGGLWAYYGHWLTRTLKEEPEAPRRAGMRRLYFYILSAIGLTAVFVGLNMLLSFSSDLTVLSVAWWDFMRLRLSTALAILAVGLPLWGLTWTSMQGEALAEGEAGDHARRSLTRRIYLYLALFVSLIGVMVSAGLIIFTVLSTLLGSPPDNWLTFIDSLRFLFLFTLLGAYHVHVLRIDLRRAASVLAEKHAAFPTLIFDPGDGAFAAAVRETIQKNLPTLPISVHPADQPVPTQTAPRAVILPGDLALAPPAALRKWLEKYEGVRIVVPRPAAGWVWAGGVREGAALAQAVKAIRQLAEGQEVRFASGSQMGMVFVYILAVIGGLQVLGLLFSLSFMLVGG